MVEVLFYSLVHSFGRKVYKKKLQKFVNGQGLFLNLNGLYMKVFGL